MVHSFLNSFWDQDFNGTTGYDTLIYRLKDGKKLCDAFSEFLRNRAKLEDEYGKNLIRLAQSAATNEETGSLKESWDSIRKEAESIGSSHCELSKKLIDLTEKTVRFRENQKAERLKVDDRMKKYQKDKKITHENMLKAKRAYEQRCKETDQAKDTYESKATYTPKEEERFKRNLLKAKTGAESADCAYQSSVKALEDCRKKWMFEMEDALKHFQKWEEERVTYLRNEMWTYVNLASLQLLTADESYENNQEILEKCDETIDIQLFINLRRTGSERPAAILYENYYHHTMPPDENAYADPNTHVISSSRGSLKNTYTQPMPFISQSNSSSDSYSTVDDLRNDISSLNTKHKMMRAIFEYKAQGSEELTLRPGDIIEVMQVEDALWGIGYLNGAKGAFPMDFVENV